MLFTSASDAWAFGVLMWEVFELGASPYSTVQVTTLVDELERGLRLAQPRQCPDNMFALMRNCWEWDPKMRPKFAELASALSRMCDESAAYDKVQDGDYANIDGSDADEGAMQVAAVYEMALQRGVGNWMEGQADSVL